jgi:hypothetical protein
LYSKDRTTNIGTRVFVSPTDCSIFAQTAAPSYGTTTPTLKIDGSNVMFNVPNVFAIRGNNGAASTMMSVTQGNGLNGLMVGSKLYAVQTDGGTGLNLYLPTSISHTITHRTNVLDFEPEQVGCFCESTGRLADVYDKDGVPYAPTLDRPCDAIVKVRHSISLNARVLGIITDDHTIASHGDVLCRVINTVDWSIVYELGQVLVPDIQGLCRAATHTERKFAANHQIHLPRITALFAECEFVAAFIG